MFKVGDRVRIRKDSEFHSQNSNIGNGKITSVSGGSKWDKGIFYELTFQNMYKNGYRIEDLELVRNKHKHTLNCKDERCGQQINI